MRARDQRPGATHSLAGNGHTSFVLSIRRRYPVTATSRHHRVRYARRRPDQRAGHPHHAAPSNTLTTIPALANVGTGGGSIAHLARGDGWQTTFVLVNTGASAAQAHLSFFDDRPAARCRCRSHFRSRQRSRYDGSSVNANAGGGRDADCDSGAASNPAPTIGSAQLSTSGNIGGFVIFRYNPNGQEAVVPLESRNAGAYLLASTIRAARRRVSRSTACRRRR